MRRPARRGGFTLIELLVAISILAIVAVLGWRGLDGIIRSRQTLTAQMEQTRGMQLAFAQLQSDCEHLAPAALLHFRANLQTDPDRLTLVRTVLTENEPSRLQVVAYRVIDGVLIRRESAATRDLIALDTLWQAALAEADPTPGVGLQSGVAGFGLRVWQDGSWKPKAVAQVAPLLNNAPDGLELRLRLLGQDTPDGAAPAEPLLKIFLLGGA